MKKVLIYLAFLLMSLGYSNGQTATLTAHNTTTIPYNGQAVPVHLSWNAIAPPTGWVVVDYCLGGSGISGQEHAGQTIGGILYKGCGLHAATTSADVFPFTGPGFWVVWAELKSTDGTKIALSADSNEASCDFEVLSTTSSLTTYFCKGGASTKPNAPVTNGVWN